MEVYNCPIQSAFDSPSYSVNIVCEYCKFMLLLYWTLGSLSGG